LPSSHDEAQVLLQLGTRGKHAIGALLGVRVTDTAQQKTGQKTDTKHTPEPTPSHPPTQSQSQSQSHAHGRQSSKDSICDYTPYVNRRVLDTQTEHDLRLACKLILQNFKPSDHGMEDTDPKLDFGAMQRGRDHKTKDCNTTRSEPKVRLPTGAPVDLKTALEARGLQQTELTLRNPGDPLPVRANSSRKRADFGWLDERGDKREEKLRKYDTSLPASVPSFLTFNRSGSIRRKSRQFDSPAAAADAEATEWMRQEREKQDPNDPQARPSTAVRPPSRARSIRNNIKEYVFPGTASRSLSRAPSHGSLRTLNTTVSQESPIEPPHSASGQGWRSWALPRRSTSRSNSRPGTSKGHPDDAEQKKPNPNAVNLNRELPPLPSLDSWKEAVQPPPQKVTSPTSGTHIASLMRPQDSPQSERHAGNKSHRRSGSDTLAMQHHASQAARSPSHNKHPAQSGSRSKTLTPDSLAISGKTLIGSVSTSNLGHARQKSSDSVSTPKKSGNFSRKMSVETPTHSTFSHEVKVSRKEEQKSRLKKVFTGWMTKKDKKEDWMHRIEKEGVKEGVMVQDEAASAPVVRY
jgi:hypothetical protein